MGKHSSICTHKSALIALAVLLAGCGGGESKKAEEKKPAAPPPPVYRVRLTTNKGDMVLEAHREWAPRGADHFYELVRLGYYNESRFHRVIRNFVAQFGVHRDPQQGRLWSDLRLPDDPVKQSNKRGFVTFAHSGPNTRTTQVFINLRDNTSLDKSGFAPFARVVEGMDVADRLYFSYGEMAPKGAGPDPVRIYTEGNAYLERDFPRLSYIESAVVLP